MTTPKKDLTKQQFYYLTVMYQAEDYVGRNGKHLTKWHCQCKCGKELDVLQGSLVTGNTKSCGCYAKEKGKKMGKHNIYHVNPNAFAKNSYDLNGEYGIGYSLDKTSYFIFDKEDYELIKDYYWIEKQDDNYKYWYAQTDEGILRLHRLIMHCTDPNKVVDHIHHKVYDNRKKELRICERYQNSINSKTYSNNTSGRKGVYWDKNRKKWLAMITTNKKTQHLGRFDSFEEAVLARENAEKIYHKEFHYEE